MKRFGVSVADRRPLVLQAIDAARYGAPGVVYRRETGPGNNRSSSTPGTFNVPSRHIYPTSRPLTPAIIDETYPLVKLPEDPEELDEDQAEADDTEAAKPEPGSYYHHLYSKAYRRATTQIVITIPRRHNAPAKQEAERHDDTRSECRDEVYNDETELAPAQVAPLPEPAPLVAVEPPVSPQLAASQQSPVTPQPVTLQAPTNPPTSASPVPGAQVADTAQPHTEQQQQPAQPLVGVQTTLVQQNGPRRSFEPSLRPLPSIQFPDGAQQGAASRSTGQQSDANEAEFVIINGVKTRKRRATTEIQPVAQLQTGRAPAPRNYITLREERSWARSARGLLA